MTKLLFVFQIFSILTFAEGGKLTLDSISTEVSGNLLLKFTTETAGKENPVTLSDDDGLATLAFLQVLQLQKMDTLKSIDMSDQITNAKALKPIYLHALTLAENEMKRMMCVTDSANPQQAQHCKENLKEIIVLKKMIEQAPLNYALLQKIGNFLTNELKTHQYEVSTIRNGKTEKRVQNINGSERIFDDIFTSRFPNFRLADDVNMNTDKIEIQKAEIVYRNDGTKLGGDLAKLATLTDRNQSITKTEPVKDSGTHE